MKLKDNTNENVLAVREVAQKNRAFIIKEFPCNKSGYP